MLVRRPNALFLNLVGTTWMPVAKADKMMDCFPRVIKILVSGCGCRTARYVRIHDLGVALRCTSLNAVVGRRLWA